MSHVNHDGKDVVKPMQKMVRWNPLRFCDLCFSWAILSKKYELSGLYVCCLFGLVCLRASYLLNSGKNTFDIQ